MKLKEIQEMMPKITGGKEITYKQMEYSSHRKIETLCEGTYYGYQFYILNLGTHPTAYIEIPRESKLFGKGYGEIYDMGINIDVHGGLTYADDDLETIKENTWFIGWDYAHCGDYAGYYDLMPNPLFRSKELKKWTTEEIFEDVANAIEQIREEERK